MIRALVLSLLAASTAFANEQPLSFTVTGKTNDPGVREVLVSTTPRFGRPINYLRLENIAGVGYGFTRTLEAQLLLAVTIESIGLDGRAAEGGAHLRLRWQPLNSGDDFLGLGLVATVGATTTTLLAEGRLGAEKWVGDFLFALNASVDYRLRRDGAPGPDLHLEQSGGLVYRLANRFTSGFEVRSRIGFDHGEYFGAAISAGPVFGYRGKLGWFSLALLPQVAAVKAQSQVGNGEALELRDNERVVVRLQLGFEL